MIEERNIRNIYVAREIVKRYNWKEMYGRELEKEDRAGKNQLRKRYNKAKKKEKLKKEASDHGNC